MKKIDNMTVTVTYTVELNDVEVPDNVYDVLAEYDKIDTGTITPDSDYYEALDWLGENIEERDGMEWEYEEDVDIDVDLH